MEREIVTIYRDDLDALRESNARKDEKIKKLWRRITELEGWKIEHSGNYRHAGRPRNKWEDGKKFDWYRMWERGESIRHIAEIYGASYSTVQRRVKEAKKFFEYEKKHAEEHADEEN